MKALGRKLTTEEKQKLLKLKSVNRMKLVNVMKRLIHVSKNFEIMEVAG